MSVPSQNAEAEVSVLGSVLLSERALDAVVDEGLRPGDFYRESHGLIFGAMLRLWGASPPSPVDALTVSEQLAREGALDGVGGTAYVHSLPSVVPSAGNVRHYARIVREHALTRRLLDALRETQEEVRAGGGSARELLERAESRLFGVARDDGGGGLRPIGDVLSDELDRLERVSRGEGTTSGTPSGFRDLDALTGGFQPGNLVVLAARPAMGKSALAVNVVENAAVGGAVPSALFSLEMSEQELAQRLVASQALIGGDDLRKGRVGPERWPKVVAAAERLARAPLFVDDSAGLGVLELRTRARRLSARDGLGLVVVDYLQLMRPEDPSVSRVEQIGQISRGLKLLARELAVPVIAVSQLSRAVESRPDKRPLLSDLRESGNIEQDADLVMFIYRDDYYNRDSERPGEADLILAKHRNGPTGDVALAFQARYPKFLTRHREGDA